VFSTMEFQVYDDTSTVHDAKTEIGTNMGLRALRRKRGQVLQTEHGKLCSRLCYGQAVMAVLGLGQGNAPAAPTINLVFP